MGGLKGPPTNVEPRVDCRRKSQVRSGAKGGANPDDDSFATERIPKMELLKVNYVNLKHEEEQKQKKQNGEIEKKKVATTGGGDGRVRKGCDDRKKASTATIVVCSGKVSGGGKGATSAATNQPPVSPCTSGQKTDAKQGGNVVAAAAAACGDDHEPNDGSQEEVGKSKYLVYKKHNGFGTSAPSATECSTTVGAKLQYINDSDIKIKALAKKRYGALFENKKKSKLETVQYYFDSRGYERYVDNKLYGVINDKKGQPDVAPVSSAPPPPQSSGDGQHKRLSWDVRQHNRPSMMRVINQSAAAKKCANVIMMNQQTSVKPLSAEAPDVLVGGGGGGGLKQENCRMFKLQKSHTSTNLLTRHRSMNDIHRINQLFQETRVDPDPSPLPPSTHANPRLPTNCATSSPVSNGTPPPVPVHRFEKHRKSEQTKYLVHKRLSARYKTECNLPTTLLQPPTPATSPAVVLSSGLTGEDTISKRIRQIIDGQDKIGSTETVDQEPLDVDEQPPRHRQLQHQRHLPHGGANGNKFRQLCKSKSADKLVGDETRAEDEPHGGRNGKSVSTCGYKNCKFSNCPMSSASSSSSSSSSSASSTVSMTTCSTTTNSVTACTANIHAGRTRTSIVINDNDDDDAMQPPPDPVTERKQEKFVINNLILNNGKLNEKVSNVNRGKDDGDDLRIIVSSKIKEIDLESNSMIIEKCVASARPDPNAAMAARQKFWNQQNQRNIKLKNNPQTKAYDDKMNINNKIKNEENNSIKIFISSNGEGGNSYSSEPVSLVSTVAAGNSSNRSSLCSYSSASSCGSTGSDSDKDDGYCDQSERSVSPEKQQPSSLVSTISNTSSSSSTVRSESTNISSVTCTKSLPNGGSNGSGMVNAPNRYTSKTSIRLGCDGTLFLNNGYLDEVEHYANGVVVDTGSGGNDGQSCVGAGSTHCCCRKRQQSLCVVSSVDVKCLHSTGPECDRYANAAAITGGIGVLNAGAVVKSKSGHCTCAKNQKNALHKIESFSPRPRSIEGPLDSGISISSDTVITSSDSDLNLQSQTDADERKLKRGHVLAELLETERIYVAEMGSILRADPERVRVSARSLPNVRDLISADSFKNFDYVQQANTLRRFRPRQSSPTSSGGCRLNERRQIFLPVNSDGEDDPRHGRTSPFLPAEGGAALLLGEVITTSDQTNRPYIFDDIGVYETIRSRSKKELFRAEMRTRKETLISGLGDRHKLGQQLPPRYATDAERQAMRNGHGCSATLPKLGYKDEMLSEEMSSLVPPGLQGKSDVLFGNLHELYTFHNDIFLKDLENCISTTELVALCFVQRRDTFFRLYSYYCQNIPRSERLRETLVDTHLFLQECQKKLGHKLPLAAYLLKPVQRITKYQLLLKDLLKFSDTGTCSRELQKALDCMLVVLKCVNDSMHQIAITGFPADLSQQGELLMQDSFQVWTESKKDLRLRLKTQNRHIFLYQKAMLFCKQGSKTGHNKSTYQFKHWLQMSQIGLTESVRGDSRRFEVWLQGRQEVHTIQAGTIEIKHKWVAEIKRVLLNQLEELKGEKIKQYGLNHKSLRHTASWDVPQAVHGTPNRTAGGDQPAQSQPNGLGVGGMVGLAQDVVTRIAHLNDDSLLNATGISSSSSEHDNQETNAWSSDYSNSEDEFTTVEDSVVPGHKFVSLADYCAMGNSEVSMKEAEVVELLKVGCAGWWFVKVIATGLEGWAPAAYLEPVMRKNSRLRSARSQDKLNDH
uniref:Guanine nucleotide exchange factor DBS n=1 Tax=Anopheles farauti TaxID=69004 RepID=A0A182Q4T4_9DIPT